MAKRKEEEREPKIARVLNVEDLKRLLQEIEYFAYSFEEMHCNERELSINIYDNGKIELEGEFSTIEKKEIVI